MYPAHETGLLSHGATHGTMQNTNHRPCQPNPHKQYQLVPVSSKCPAHLLGGSLLQLGQGLADHASLLGLGHGGLEAVEVGGGRLGSLLGDLAAPCAVSELAQNICNRVPMQSQPRQQLRNMHVWHE